MPRQPHDRFFKQLLASPDAALALFGMVLPAGVLDGVKPDDLQHGDGALTAHRRVRYPDRLYGLRLPGRTRLLILLEHQTRPDPDMPLRLLDEVLTLSRSARADRTHTDRPHANRPHGAPTPIVCVVVYQGRAAWPAPLDLRERFCVPGPRGEPLAAFAPSFRYGLVDLQRTGDDALPTHPGLRLGLTLLKHAHSRDPWPVLLREASTVRAILNAGGGPALAPALGYAAEIARHAPPPGFGRELAIAAGYTLKEVFMSYASQLRREGRQEGRQEGLQEGVQEGERRGEVVGQRKMLQRLMERRFGALDAPLISHISSANLDQIAACTDRLLTAPSARLVLFPQPNQPESNEPASNEPESNNGDRV